ncbi:hypothetical protein DSCOOX_31010 [Desulfosarcina ovata subsp. ovata]|uniref:Uncharacterized protein n=2 Tax=Desulfosarcina ovata TaxID=83564 RepID=A0A5K8ABL2_9BACT|nr:hypothetical protein DSCOOX_31010 [Desulfosarcina ovata subsp. ovata]
MFDVWGIADVPKGYRIIRIEFQLRREVLKQLGMNSPSDLNNLCSNAWGYCTQEWLNFKDNPGKHQKNQRKTLTWWSVVQNGFMEISQPVPLIRFRASNSDEKQLVAQTFGYLSSIQALMVESNGNYPTSRNDIENVLLNFPLKANELGKGQREFKDAIELKRAKYVRTQEKLKMVIERRKEFFNINLE